VKKFLLAIAFTSVFAAGAMAQSSGQGVTPRDPPFGRGDASNDTMHEPNSAGSGHGYGSNQGLLPRDPPFGRGDASNDTMHEPSSADTARAANQNPPRDPPYGKGM
jgi:hypothetical protein